MANYGPVSFAIAYDNGGGAPQTITQYVQTINDVNVEQLIEETRSLGDAWEEHMPIGVGKMDPVELSGLYDDAASPAPDALFANRIPETPATATRTLTITWGGTKTTSVETRLVNYKRKADKGALTRYTVTLQPTGTVTEV